MPLALLGVLADHYVPESARLELNGWLAAHDNDIEPLLLVVADCPFRWSAAAMTCPRSFGRGVDDILASLAAWAARYDSGMRVERKGQVDGRHDEPSRSVG